MDYWWECRIQGIVVEYGNWDGWDFTVIYMEPNVRSYTIPENSFEPKYWFVNTDFGHMNYATSGRVLFYSQSFNLISNVFRDNNNHRTSDQRERMNNIIDLIGNR